MNDYKQNITLSDAYGQGYLSLFYDFSSELLPHEMALLELLETLDYSNFDASLKSEYFLWSAPPISSLAPSVSRIAPS